jgi:APA family basic amino acid/polyamine antiporter
VLPAVFSRVHQGRRTPWVAILFVTTIGLIMLISLGAEALDTLSSTTVVLLLLAFIAVNASVLALRGDRVEHEHFRTPSVFPVLGIVISLALLIYSGVSDITIFVLAGVLLLLGVVLYGVDVLVKSRLDRERPEASVDEPPESRS